MAAFTPQQLKKALLDQGFEVFRTRGDEVVLAERVRENLIMDSGVRLRASEPLQVRVVLRAQQADFPNLGERDLFDRVRELAGTALQDGFAEAQTHVSPVKDPADAERVLDTFYEVTFTRDAGDLADAVTLLRYALRLEKTATPRRPSE